MHSAGQIDANIDYFSADSPPDAAGWSRFAAEARARFAAKRARLAEEHHDLDEMIALLAGANAADDALLTRLKKRKLSIKDEIARIEAAATL